MNESFLTRLSKEILQKCGDDLSAVAVVFPTRRAGLFFKKSLSELLTKPVWSPSVYSIQDFIRQHTALLIPDQLLLQVELFKVYKRYYPAENFESFLPWADILLKDFDDVDKYLVNSSSFFKNISDLKQLEESFGLSAEDEAHVHHFWKVFYEKEAGELKKNFIQSWKYLHNIYTDFKTELLRKGWAYEGLAYRTFYESLQSGTFQPVFSKVVFAGLYVLSSSEEAIIKHIVDSGKGLLYWDTDSYYVDDENQEAGKFIRKNKLINSLEYNWKFDFLKSVPKEIFSIGVSSPLAGVRQAGQVLQELICDKGVVSNRIAVVLPDEKMLFPVLYSLPECVEAINVTMGFPLSETPLFGLIESLMNLNRNARRDGNKQSLFYHKHIVAVLSHPYIQLSEADFCRIWFEKYLVQKWIWVDSDQLTGRDSPELIRLLFKPFDFAEIFDYLKSIFEKLIVQVLNLKGHTGVVESEFLFQFYTQLNRLPEILPFIEEESLEVFWSIFKKILREIKIPFTGEPLQGLQVMGLLESRLLDFDYVIFLSANEDNLPQASHRVSYVPYTIRKAFGLPTYEENNAATAYHFYRLLQRAKGVYMIYNTESNGLTSGEKSRYINQLQIELTMKNPRVIQFREQLSMPPVRSDLPKEIIIEKTKAVMEAMNVFISKDTVNKQYSRKISPSAISTYIHCKLKFYFSYVAGLREAEEVEDDIDARTFGDILHATLQHLLKTGVTYSKEDIDLLIGSVGRVLGKVIEEKFKTPVQLLEGKNIILHNVLTHLVNEIIRQDSLRAPFSIKHLEENFILPFTLSSGQVINIGGVVDRIDEQGGEITIIDYKTGNVKFKSLKALPDLFNDINLKENFQTFFYAYVYSRITNANKIKSGLYLAKDLKKGIKYINNEEIISSEQMMEFESNLSILLDEIFDERVSFTQTDEVSRCKHCSFKEICSR